MTFFHLILNRSYNLMFISINLGLFGIRHVFSLNFQEDIQTFKFSLTERDFFFFKYLQSSMVAKAMAKGVKTWSS